jgi:aminocarboxymuconate-semialdehyde decarboxylase
VFASDCPFDPEGGSMYVRETLRILDKLQMDQATADKVFWKNLEAVTGRKIVK